MQNQRTNWLVEFSCATASREPPGYFDLEILRFLFHPARHKPTNLQSPSCYGVAAKNYHAVSGSERRELAHRANLLCSAAIDPKATDAELVPLRIPRGRDYLAIRLN